MYSIGATCLCGGNRRVYNNGRLERGAQIAQLVLTMKFKFHHNKLFVCSSKPDSYILGTIVTTYVYSITTACINACAHAYRQPSGRYKLPVSKGRVLMMLSIQWLVVLGTDTQTQYTLV